MNIFQLCGEIVINGAEAANSIVKGVGKTAERMGERLKSVGSTVTNIGMTITKGMLAAGTAVAGAGGAVIAFAGKAASTGDNVDKMSQKIGISRTAYQELDFACSQCGTSVDTFQMGLKTMTNTMQSAAAGNKTACSTFDALGVSIYDSSGQLKSQEAMMWEVMSALQGVENQTEKAALANDLFGRSGSELMPMLNGEKGSIDALRQQAHDLNLVMSDEAVNAAVAYTDTMDQLKRSFGAVTAQLGVALMPYIQKFAQLVIEHMPQIRAAAEKVSEGFARIAAKVGELIAWFNNLSPNIQATIKTIAGIVVAIGPALSVIGVLISSVGTLSTAFSMVCSPIGLVVTAIAGLIAGFVALYNTNEEFRAVVDVAWTSIKEVVSSAINALQEFISAFVGFAKGIWQRWGDDITNIATKAFSLVSSKVQTALDVIKGIIKTATAILKGDWSGAWDALKGTVSSVWDGIKNVVSKGVDLLKSIMKFDWSLPKIKLPHFSISGSFSLNPPSIPHFSVSWYKKAMDNPLMFTKPTIFGVNGKGQPMGAGDAGDEVMIGKETMLNMMRDAVSSEMDAMRNDIHRLVTIFEMFCPDALAAMERPLMWNETAIARKLAPAMNTELGQIMRNRDRGR